MHFDFLIPVLYTDGEVAFYGGLADRLTKLGLTVGFIPFTRRGERALRERHPHVFYPYEDFDPRRPLPLDEQRALERRYDLVSLADHVYSERQYPWARGLDALVPRAAHLFRFLEGLLAKHSVTFFLNNIGGEVIRRCMSRLAACGGPRNLIVDFAPLHGRIALTTSEVSWDDLPAAPPALSDDERRFAEQMVAEVRERRQMFCAPSKVGVSPSNFLNACRYFRETLDEPQVDYSIAALCRDRAQRIARRAVNPRFYSQPVPGERYVFFPLHLASDSAITIRAPQFQRQENLVEYLAERALPSGVKLYVKPHVGAQDAYAIPMVARMSRIPGVRLIHPTVHSHSLIAGAEAMTVINSTVGFESLFYDKPVVVLGRVFYRGFGVTHDVENLGDLPRVVRRAIAEPPEHEAVLRFLHACHVATSPGRFGDASDENLDLVSRALLAKAGRLGVNLRDHGGDLRAQAPRVANLA